MEWRDGRRRGWRGSWLLNNSVVFSMAYNPPKAGTQFVQRRGRAERKQLWPTQKSLATTSCSWVLALQLHYAGKCNFSSGDYKIHVPKGEKNTMIDHFARNYPNARWHQWLKRRILSRQHIFLFYSWTIKNSKNVGIKLRAADDLRFSLPLQIEWTKEV